jgi:hypothetical protein
MITQKFKGDDTELKMEAAAESAFDLCDVSLDKFYQEGYDASPFLLMLYDEGRMPFSDRVPRDSFVEFIREALERFPFTGTFESYIFILQAIFGPGSGVLFNVPAAGKLEILVNASSSLEFDLVAREVIEGVITEFTMVDYLGNTLTARGLSGIDSEFELQMLLAELIPAGIFPDITLAFFALYSFVDYLDNSIVDHLGNQIVFIES